MIDRALAGLQAGKAVILPMDTVYGLCANPYGVASVERLQALKGRPQQQPVALVAVDVDFLLECVPELHGRSAVIARALLPGPYTLVLPNPARRFRWLSGSSPGTIGVRVPDVDGASGAVLELAGAVAATSANLAGGPDARRVEDIPESIRSAVAAIVDGGELPGTPSTVLDFTGPEPRVLREGGGPVAEALERAAAAVI